MLCRAVCGKVAWPVVFEQSSVFEKENHRMVFMLFCVSSQCFLGPGRMNDIFAVYDR